MINPIIPAALLVSACAFTPYAGDIEPDLEGNNILLYVGSHEEVRRHCALLAPLPSAGCTVILVDQDSKDAAMEAWIREHGRFDCVILSPPDVNILTHELNLCGMGEKANGYYNSQ